MLDFTENADGTLEFKEAGYFIPENANEWVSQIFRVQNNQNGTFTYFGATGDGIIGAGAGPQRDRRLQGHAARRRRRHADGWPAPARASRLRAASPAGCGSASATSAA